MRNLKRKLDWIDEWQHQSHETQDISIPQIQQVDAPDKIQAHAPVKLGLIQQEIATLPPPDFLISKPLESKNPEEEQKPFQRKRLKEKKENPVNFFKRLLHWCYEELSFTMSKISVFGLVIGLMLLGALLFVGGFLIAFSQYSPHPPAPQSAWATANNHVQQTTYPGGQEGHPNQHQGIHHGPHRRNIAVGIANNEIRSRTSGITSHLNLQRFNSHVPAPLAPFSNYANSAVSSNVQGTVRGATNQITAPLHGADRTNIPPTSQQGQMQNGGWQNDRSQPVLQQQASYGPQQVHAGQNSQQKPMNQPIYQTQQASIHAPYPQQNGQQNLQQQPRQYAHTPSYLMQKNSDKNITTYPNTRGYAPVEQGKIQHPSWSSIQERPTYIHPPQPSFPAAPQTTPHSITPKNAWTQQNQQYTERQG